MVMMRDDNDNANDKNAALRLAQNVCSLSVPGERPKREGEQQSERMWIPERMCGCGNRMGCYVVFELSFEYGRDGGTIAALQRHLLRLKYLPRARV